MVHLTKYYNLYITYWPIWSVWSSAGSCRWL